MNVLKALPVAQAFVCVAVFHSICMTESLADYHQYNLLTVEWLVDSSDAIVVTRRDGANGKREIIETLKGSLDSLDDTPRQASQMQLGSSGTSIFGPPTKSEVELLFMKDGVVLQSVGLGRHVRMQSELHVQSIWYGVTQYGRLLLEPSDLLDAIRKRAHMEMHAEATENEAIGVPRRLVYAGENFPFESTDELFYLVVPKTNEWRDHYIKVLNSGDAAQRMDAITKLKAVADRQSISAIRSATEVAEIPIGYRQVWRSSDTSPVLTASDVRAHAKSVLKQTN